MRSLRLLAAAVAAFLLAVGSGCGGDSSSPPPPPPPGSWTWVPLAGTACSDGSETGIGIDPGAGDTPDVLVFLMGGGACWDYLTCFLYGAATPGPFGQAEFEDTILAFAPGSILDRDLAANPLKDYTLVFVPYCTGDVHVGNTVQTYAPGATWYHKGRVNLAAAFEHLGASLSAPAKVVVSGSSAGGFGSLYAFDLARKKWPGAKGYLVDDSGPPIQGIPPTTVTAWYDQWDMGGAITPLCGAADCRNDLSLVFPALADRYQDDRLALLSSTEDGIIRLFFGPSLGTPMDATTFENELRALATGVIGGTLVPNGRSFLYSGTTHTMLGTPAAFSSEGVALTEWLRQEVEDDPDWATVAPPRPP